MKRIDFVKVSLFFCFCLFLCGCENDLDQRVAISGTISVDGERLERGVVSFVSVDDPNIIDGGVVENGVFECETTTGEKQVRCFGSKVVGTYAPDPLFPDRVVDKLEELPESAFSQEIQINVKGKGGYFVIKYEGDLSSD